MSPGVVYLLLLGPGLGGRATRYVRPSADSPHIGHTVPRGKTLGAPLRSRGRQERFLRQCATGYRAGTLLAADLPTGEGGG